jgi:hypothetical protein
MKNIRYFEMPVVDAAPIPYTGKVDPSNKSSSVWSASNLEDFIVAKKPKKTKK